MCGNTGIQVAILDYGMGNLFSIEQACSHVGLSSTITSSGQEITSADALILPGVGSFGDAMATLNQLDLVPVILDFVASGKPLIGICLGMQLLMGKSQEFGQHQGLGIIEGEVMRLEEAVDAVRQLKVPHVGWNQIHPARQSESEDNEGIGPTSWLGTPLTGLQAGEFMYFIHSFYPTPADPSIVVSTTQYGGIDFCSSFQLGNIFACQFHPERSGPQGLQIYRNLSTLISKTKLEGLNV